MLRLLLLVTMWSVVMSSEWYWPESQRVLENALGEKKKPILWMTTDKIDNIPRYMFENWRNYTKGYDVRIYDDEQVDTYMRKHCYGLFELYTELGNYKRPFKYDIWRSCALFTEGGFYMDIKTVLNQPLKSFVRPGAITMTRGHLYPIQGIHIGFMGGPPKKSIFGKFLVEAREHGPKLSHYHYYGTLMSRLAKRYTEVVYLDETTKSYPGCVPDRYGLCARIYDDQERLVAYTRDPKYPWRTDAGVVNQLDDVNGEYFALSHKKMNPLEPTVVNYLSTGTFPLNPNAHRVSAKCKDIEYEMFIHDPTDCIYLSSELYFNGQWECNSVNEIVQTLRKSPHGNRTTFLDIGANIGSYTIPIAKSGFRVIGFEPMQYNHELLAASIGTYNLSNMVDIYPTAVSNSISTVCLATSSDQHGNGIIVECNRAKSNGWNYQTIYTGMIDDILSNHDLCYTVVKADVEGFELQAFKGAIQKVFQSHCPPEMVLFEHHMKIINTKVPTNAPMFEFMTRMGYQCIRFSLTDFKCVPIGKTLKPYNITYFKNMWEKKEKNLRVKRLKVDALRKDKAKMKSIPHKMHFIWMQKNLLTEPLTSQTERDNAENVRTIADMNPEYDVHFYDDAACQRECRQTDIEGVPELYEDMRGATSFGPSSWAIMADVCRLAILYNHGGVYMDANMAMRLPFKAWLREDVSFVAPMSVCKLKRDFGPGFFASTRAHPATRLTLERMVRDWDGHTFRALTTHYTENEKSMEWCPLYMGTIYPFLGWNATNREDTQLLDERIHWRGTFPGVQSRLHKNGYHSIGCSAIVVDPSTGQVPFYSHTLKRGNCVVVNENTLIGP